MTVWIPIAFLAFPLGVLLGQATSDRDDGGEEVAIILAVASLVASIGSFGYWLGVR